MNKQVESAQTFAARHVKGDPLVLHNIWDAGSAQAVAKAGAVAIATGSWSVAAAQGYADGENIPLDLLMTIVGRIVSSVSLPVSVDIEGGYGRNASVLAQTVGRVIDAGAIGINFEDQVVGDGGIYCPEEQAARIRTVRETAEDKGIPLFINARTDLFLKSDAAGHSALLDDAVARAEAYHGAGASGLFVPGLVEEGLIAKICGASPMPVNVMMADDAPPISRLAALGVSRVSHGPVPFLVTMGKLREIAAS